MEQLGLKAPVTLEMSWPELFSPENPEQQRRDRWAQWLRLSRQEGRDGARYWADATGCEGCKHLRGRWCSLQGLPCTVNPYLTFKHSMIGMACMGAGFEERT